MNIIKKTRYAFNAGAQFCKQMRVITKYRINPYETNNIIQNIV